jgi:hypothetical protein
VTMVAQNGKSANQDLSWAALLGKRQLRGSAGLGLHAACWISENQGFAVIPTWPIARMNGDKVPLEKWRDLEYRTPLEIRRDSKFRMKCGVAILSGKSGLVVIDIDDEGSWAAFVGDRSIPATLELSTHSGRHLVFRDDGVLYKTQGAQLASGVDVRGRGGIFVVYDPDQPERHFTDLSEPASVPAWLQREIPLAGSRSKAGKSRDGKRGSVNLEGTVRSGIPHGQHHDRLLALALSMANQGWTDREAWLTFALGAIGKRGKECNCTDDEIYAFFDTAMDRLKEENKRKNSPERVLGYGQAQITQSYTEVEEEIVNWIWSRYFARGVLTQIDGEKGQAKTFVIADIIARATRGLPMPGEEEAICEPLNVFLFAEDVPSIIRKRLRAAGADLSRVHFPHRDYRDAIIRAQAKMERRSDDDDKEEDQDLSLLLPNGATMMLGMIEQAHAGMVVWDPITDYLDRSISTGIDADVRHALNPIVRGLEDMHVSGISLRHMNKNPTAAARHRGGGSQAFQNRARVHLVTGRLADEHMELGTFGLSMVDNNYVPRVKGTLTYDIVDSDIELDDIGNMIGKVEWHDLEEDIDPDTLTRGNDGDPANSKRGPKPAKRAAIKAILAEMGEISGTWDVQEARAYIDKKMEENGHDIPNPRTVDKAREESLIRTVSRKGHVGLNDWIWPAQRVPKVRS